MISARKSSNPPDSLHSSVSSFDSSLSRRSITEAAFTLRCCVRRTRTMRCTMLGGLPQPCSLCMTGMKIGASQRAIRISLPSVGGPNVLRGPEHELPGPIQVGKVLEYQDSLVPEQIRGPVAYFCSAAVCILRLLFMRQRAPPRTPHPAPRRRESTSSAGSAREAPPRKGQAVR